MSVRRATAAGLAALGLGAGIAACGSSGTHTPKLSQLPLVAGAHMVVQTTECDPGTNAYCGVQFVLYDRRYANSEALLKAERDALHAHGWTDANADIGPESAADSPGHKLHLTYATAGGELDGIDFGWIKRPRRVTLALSNSIFAHTPALSMLLEIDSGAT
jgi:hypothetical protein